MSELTVLSLGWGVQSWTLAAMVALGELPQIDYAIHADTTWEHDHTYRFAEQWTPWLEDHGVHVLTVQGRSAHTMVHQSQKSAGKYIVIPAYTEYVNDTKDSGVIRRQCTGRWKIDPKDKAVIQILRDSGIVKYNY